MLERELLQRVIAREGEQGSCSYTENAPLPNHPELQDNARLQRSLRGLEVDFDHMKRTASFPHLILQKVLWDR